jgi:hypothetical protein
MRSISSVTCARQVEREFVLSMMARLDGLLRSDRLASDMSAVTRVMIILKQCDMRGFVSRSMWEVFFPL